MVPRFADFSPDMMAVVKACLQPEPAKRLTALEILALPYFDDIYDHLEGTELQQDYDGAYAAAAEAKAPSARSLWTASSACTKRRVKGGGAVLRADAVAKGLIGAEDLPTDAAAGAGLCIDRLARSRSTAGIMLTAPDILIPACALAANPESDRADAATAGAATTLAPLSSTASHSDPTRTSAGMLRRATTMGAPRAEDMHTVFSALDPQGRAVMHPLPTPAEAEAAAAVQLVAAAGGRGRIGCRVHFSGEGSESHRQHHDIARRMRASEDCGVDLLLSSRNSHGGQLVSSGELRAD